MTTDAWAPVVDCAARSSSIYEALADETLPPGVSVLLGAGPGHSPIVP